MGSQTSIASVPTTVPDGISDTVQEDLMKQLLPPEEITLDSIDPNRTNNKRPASATEESEPSVQVAKRPKIKSAEAQHQQQSVSPLVYLKSSRQLDQQVQVSRLYQPLRGLSLRRL